MTEDRTDVIWKMKLRDYLMPDAEWGLEMSTNMFEWH